MVQNQVQMRPRNPQFLSQTTSAWDICVLSSHSISLADVTFCFAISASFYSMVSGMPALTIVIVKCPASALLLDDISSFESPPERSEFHAESWLSNALTILYRLQLFYDMYRFGVCVIACCLWESLIGYDRQGGRLAGYFSGNGFSRPLRKFTSIWVVLRRNFAAVTVALLENYIHTALLLAILDIFTYSSRGESRTDAACG